MTREQQRNGRKNCRALFFSFSKTQRLEERERERERERVVKPAALFYLILGVRGKFFLRNSSEKKVNSLCRAFV